MRLRRWAPAVAIASGGRDGAGRARGGARRARSTSRRSSAPAPPASTSSSRPPGRAQPRDRELPRRRQRARAGHRGRAGGGGLRAPRARPSRCAPLRADEFGDQWELGDRDDRLTINGAPRGAAEGSSILDGSGNDVVLRQRRATTASSTGPAATATRAAAATTRCSARAAPTCCRAGRAPTRVSYDPPLGTPRRGGVRADLDGRADDGSAGERDRIRTDVENLDGTDFSDVLRGNGRANEIDGAGGADRIFGLAGNDLITASARGDRRPGRRRRPRRGRPHRARARGRARPDLLVRAGGRRPARRRDRLQAHLTPLSPPPPRVCRLSAGMAKKVPNPQAGGSGSGSGAGCAALALNRHEPRVRLRRSAA